MRGRLVLAELMLLLGLGVAPNAGGAIPYFARKYNVSCSQCHASPPKLNGFGEEFLARGYRLPDGWTERRTWPFAVWLSGRSDVLPAVEDMREVVTYLNRLEVISGGEVIAPWLSYFVEWRPLSQEARANGTLRDRSGRFEDLFLTATGEHLVVTAGQFRQVGQVDVSRRLGLSEPLLLSASLPGSGSGSARERSLRDFSPSGRSPALRVGWKQPAWGQWRWTAAAAVPVPGEFSIPLTDSARVEASNEIELDPKGVFVELFLGRGLFSVGGHAFYDHTDRYLANGLTTGSYGDLHWTGIAGVAKRTAPATSSAGLYGQWSLEGEYIPHHLFAVGARIEDRAADGLDVAFLPYLNTHFPGTRYTIRLTVEQRFQEDRNTTLFELGTLF